MAEPGLAKMPLLAHISELKSRLIKIIIFFFFAFALSYFFAQDIYVFLTKPLANALAGEHRQMIYTNLTEAFFTYLKLAFFGATFLSFPMIAAQTYFFLAPGLYKKERHFLIPFLVAAPILFILGAAFVYYFVMPIAWRFFLSFENLGNGEGMAIILQAKIGEYLSLVMHLMLGFGLSFQLPIILIILAQLGFLQAEFLTRNRRYAVVAIVILAAVLTPPDVISQIGLAAILYALYELSIIGCKLVLKRKNTLQEVIA